MKIAQRVLALAESATLAVSSKAARMKAEGLDVIAFGAGEPEFDTPAYVRQAVVAAIEAGHTRYAKPVAGVAVAREAVCRKLKKINGLSYEPSQVIITAGGKAGVYLAIQSVVDPGDEVIIPVPYWVSYPEIVKLADAVPVFVSGREDNDYKLTPKELAAAITERTKMVILNSPSNPSSVTYSPREIRALAAVLQDRDLYILSDEIYDQLLLDGQETLSVAAVGVKSYEQTITLNAPSKTYAMTGWRLGYAAGPEPVIRAMSKLQSQASSGACTFNQHALAAALDADQSEVEMMRKEFIKRGRYMHERLTAMPGIRCPRPTGGFYCFPNVSSAYAKLGVTGSAGFADQLLEEARVAVVPGAAFGLDEHVRLSFGAGMQQIKEGLKRIEAFVG